MAEIEKKLIETEIETSGSLYFAFYWEQLNLYKEYFLIRWKREVVLYTVKRLIGVQW